MKDFFAHHEEMQIQLLHLAIFLKWLCYAGLTGILVGLAASLFSLGLGWATQLRIMHNELIWLLPLGGLVIVFLYRKAGIIKSRGTNLVISSVRSEEPLPFVTAPLIFISTMITHLFGGSAGREGAALQLGGSLAQQLGRWFHLNANDLRLITMCGMSAAFSALFGTPITATIFSMEMISVGIMHYAALVPCTIASIIALEIAKLFGIHGESFLIQIIPTFSLSLLLKVIALAILCAYVSILFCWMLHQGSLWMEKLFKNSYLRIFVGGCFIIILTLIFKTDYNGAGMNIVARALEESSVRPEAFVLKALFTAITLGAGFKGGEIVPSFFVGACFGCLMAPILGIPASFGAAIGLLVLFCGVTNCPMASLFLGIELFGLQGVVLFLIADAVGYMMSGYYGLYNEQKIMYSKYETKFIDEKANHKVD